MKPLPDGRREVAPIGRFHPPLGLRDLALPLFQKLDLHGLAPPSSSIMPHCSDGSERKGDVARSEQHVAEQQTLCLFSTQSRHYASKPQSRYREPSAPVATLSGRGERPWLTNVRRFIGSTPARRRNSRSFRAISTLT